MIKSNKIGTVSVSFIIGVVILVISFVVLLFLLFKINFNPIVDKETCHQSIVYRATAKIKAIDLSESIPLKCQTEKICLTMSGDDCELIGTKKNPVNKINLGSDKVKAKEKIKEVLVDKLVECHSMIGEGQLNFLPSHFLKLKDTKYGLICNRIIFDKEAQEQIENIGFGEFYSYLEKKTIGDKSYLDYLYPGIDDSKKFLLIYDSIKDKSKEEGTLVDGKDLPNFKEWKIDLSQENGYAIISSISTKSQGWLSLGSLGVGGIIGGGLLFTGIGSPLGVALVSGSAGGAVFWYNFDEKYDYSPPAIYPYNITKLQELGVYSFEIAP